MGTTSLADRIGYVDFDTVFRLLDGDVVRVPGQYAPDVYHCDVEDVEIHGDGWSALTGNTLQHGYNGAVMHSSEGVGTRIADQLEEMAQEDPGAVFALVVVEALDDDEPAGWAVMYRAGH